MIPSSITPTWDKIPGLIACCTTRRIENTEDLNVHIQLPGPIQMLEQVHGATVVSVDQAINPMPKADAMITTRSNLTLLIKTADCLPILLYHPPTQTLGAIHAGWRSLAGNIVQNVLDMWPETQRAQTQVYLGPCISPKHYEVGDEVSAQFANIPQALQPFPDKMALDLKAVARHHLTTNGITNIHTDSYCTYENNDLFFSYRKEGKHAGRIFSCIGYTL